MNSRRGSSDYFVIFLMIAILGGIYLYSQGFNIGIQPGAGEGLSLPFNIQLPDINVVLQLPFQESDEEEESDDGLDWENQPPPDGNTQDYKIPSSLTVFISPNPVNRGGAIFGEVVSNGYNAEVVIYAKHLGRAETVSIQGWLGGDGKFQHAQQINIAGYWEFWATCNNGAVKSNTVKLTVQGIHIEQDGHVSKSTNTNQKIEVYSHLSGNCALWADYPAGSVSLPLTNVVINSGGYGVVVFDFSGVIWKYGDYELDCMVQGSTAKSWGGTSWMDIGR